MTDTNVSGGGDTADVSPGSRALRWLGAIVLVLVVLVLFMHVFAPSIASDEAPPAGHLRSACIACHFVTGPAGDVEGR